MHGIRCTRYAIVWQRQTTSYTLEFKHKFIFSDWYRGKTHSYENPWLNSPSLLLFTTLFIIRVSCFGSLHILMIEKRRDSNILLNMHSIFHSKQDKLAHFLVTSSKSSILIDQMKHCKKSYWIKKRYTTHLNAYLKLVTHTERIPASIAARHATDTMSETCLRWSYYSQHNKGKSS